MEQLEIDDNPVYARASAVGVAEASLTVMPCQPRVICQHIRASSRLRCDEIGCERVGRAVYLLRGPSTAHNLQWVYGGLEALM